MTLDPLSAVRAYSKVQGRLRRCQNDLFFLATEVLHYDKLTEAFHKPICRWWTEHDKDPFLLFMAARAHYKTTLQIADAVRTLLIDPNATQLFLHAVEDEVQKMVEECANHFLKNDDLRRIRPEIMPSKHAKRFMSASAFTVRRSGYDRQPSVAGKAVGSEITGMHCSGVIRADDIIGRRTIEDSQLPKVKSFWRNTVMPVRMPGCRVRVTGTHWDLNDPYMDWKSNKNWISMVRSGLETDGKMDYKGTPVLLPLEEIRILRETMGPDFPFQIMNDPSPAELKPWDQSKCEHRVTLKEVQGPGFMAVMSDPAPSQLGSFNIEAERKTESTEKNYWATAAVKFMVSGMRQQIVLMDLTSSRGWSTDQGFTEMARLQRKWGASHSAIEKTGQAVAFYTEDMRRVARREGVPFNPVDLSMTYKGKNVQFKALADKAAQDEFLICETVPEQELDLFLQQARQWRPLPGGRNSLKFDDHANVVSFATDPAWSKFAPQPHGLDGMNGPFGLQKAREDEPLRRSRYCAA